MTSQRKPFKVRMKEVFFFEVFLILGWAVPLGVGNFLFWLGKLMMGTFIPLVGVTGMYFSFVGAMLMVLGWIFGAMVVLPMILILINMDVDVSLGEENLPYAFGLGLESKRPT